MARAKARATTRKSERKSNRRAKVVRSTKETSVAVELNLDGQGRYGVATGAPFLDHMLELFARHGFFDLTVKASGDLAVDAHHTVEDVGLTLGQALREALGSKEGIRRFGESSVPLDEALVSAVVDLSGRPYLSYNLKPRQQRIGDFDVELVHDFFLGLVNQAGMNLHLTMQRGRNSHHVIEAGFKAFARALDRACEKDPRLKGVLSTKGRL